MDENLENRGVGESVKRKKWEKSVNKIVYECYLRSDPQKSWFQEKAKERIWDEKGVFEATEQRLADQARAIKVNNWLSDLEIEEIARNIEKENIVDENSNNLQTQEETQEVVDPVDIQANTSSNDDPVLDIHEPI